MLKKAKQEISFSKAKQRGMVWDRAMHMYNLESIGVAPGLLHPHRTLSDMPIHTRHTDSHSFFSFPNLCKFRPFRANSG